MCRSAEKVKNTMLLSLRIYSKICLEHICRLSMFYLSAKFQKKVMNGFRETAWHTNERTDERTWFLRSPTTSSRDQKVIWPISSNFDISRYFGPKIGQNDPILPIFAKMSFLTKFIPLMTFLTRFLFINLTSIMLRNL